MSLARTTAAPSMLNIGGKQRRVYPLRDVDLGTFERWVQDQVVAVATRNLDKLEKAEDRAAMLAAAVDKASEVTFTSPKAIAYMNSVDGAAMLLWLGFRDDSIDMETVRSWMVSEDCLDQALVLVNQLNAVGDENPFAEKLAAATKKPRKRTARKKSTRR